MITTSKSKLLAARLKAEQVAEFLGFNDHDIPVLVSAKLLKPLGKPKQSATKYFALCDVQELAASSPFLHKATQVLYDYWHNRNHKKRKAQEPQPQGEPSVEIALSE